MKIRLVIQEDPEKEEQAIQFLGNNRDYIKDLIIPGYIVIYDNMIDANFPQSFPFDEVFKRSI